MRARGTTRVVRRALAAAVPPVLTVCALGVLGGCGTASESSPPAGVDGLVIPTPTPDPTDFGGAVDNPWFPLGSGTHWRYEVTDIDGTHPLDARVADGPEIAGVSTTALVRTESGRTVTDYYAQDDDGNVWWFGRAGRWRAGADGAQAGIAMLALPRVGDGYRRAYDEGVVEDTARIVSLDGSASVEAGSYDDVLQTEDRSALELGVTHDRSYARGVGLVEDDVVAGRYRSVRLVSVGY